MSDILHQSLLQAATKFNEMDESQASIHEERFVLFYLAQLPLSYWLDYAVMRPSAVAIMKLHSSQFAQMEVPQYV